MKYTNQLRHSCRVAMGRALPLGAVIGGLLSLSPLAAVAADWSYEPRVALSAEYDDNHRLTNVSGQEIEVYGPKLDARLVMRGSTPQTTFTLTPQVVFTQYIEGEEDDLENYYLRMGLDHQAERMRAYVNARYSSVITLGRFFPSGAGEDPVLGQPDPGENVPRVATPNREDRFDIAPGVAFDITQRQSLELGASYLDVSYDEQRPGDQDFENISLFANYRFKTSEMSTLALLTTFEQYDPIVDEATDYYSISGEWTRSWSETAEVYVRAGASFVDSNPVAGGTDSGSSTGFSGGVGAEWTYQVTRLFVDLNQYLDPNGDGQLVNRTQLRLGLARDLSQTTVLTFGLRGINDDAPPGDSTYKGQKYASADVGFRWRMDRQWTLFGVYEYRWKEREDAINDATSNSVNLGVAWAPAQR
jgi:hypothetical protein